MRVRDWAGTAQGACEHRRCWEGRRGRWRNIWGEVTVSSLMCLASLEQQQKIKMGFYHLPPQNAFIWKTVIFQKWRWASVSQCDLTGHMWKHCPPCLVAVSSPAWRRLGWERHTKQGKSEQEDVTAGACLLCPPLHRAQGASGCLCSRNNLVHVTPPTLLSYEVQDTNSSDYV